MVGKKKQRSKKVVYECEICHGTQDEPVVACDKCDKWHHFTCVGIDSIGKGEAWFCKKCKPEYAPLSTTSQRTTSEVLVSRENPTLPTRNPPGAHGLSYDLVYDRLHPFYQRNQQTVQQEIRQNNMDSILN